MLANDQKMVIKAGNTWRYASTSWNTDEKTRAIFELEQQIKLFFSFSYIVIINEVQKSDGAFDTYFLVKQFHMNLVHFQVKPTQ